MAFGAIALALTRRDAAAACRPRTPAIDLCREWLASPTVVAVGKAAGSIPAAAKQ